MKLSALTQGVDCTLVQGSMDTEITDVIYDSRKAENGISSFTEKNAAETGFFIDHGPDIMNMLLEK